jgi:hypothetical protein
MASFERLEQTMHAWILEATAFLAQRETESTTTLRQWQRDPDGVFRDIERPIQVWSYTDVEATRGLSSWQAVEAALLQDERLRSQMDTLVGTAFGASRLDADRACRSVLPLPSELGDVEAAFARRYGRLDRLLAATEIEQTVVWPIPGLASDQFPIVLEPDVELDWMTDAELATALNTQTLPLRFGQLPLLPPDQNHQACLRFHLRAPKVIGDHSQQSLSDVQQREELLQNLAEVFEQVLVLLFANPPAISGRTITDADWSLHTGAVLFFAVSLTPSQRARQLHLGEQAARSLVETWRQLRQPALLQQQRALALALRRLSYQAGRVRIEDELVDLLVASEALYLSDAGFEELGFRLALRSAVLSNPSSLDMTRRQVFDLMKSAYGVRSKIVHGELPKPKDVKVKGVQVPLADFVQT